MRDAAGEIAKLRRRTIEHTVELPEENVWTVVMSVAMLVGCASLLVRQEWWAVACGIVTLLSLGRWMWPVQSRVLETEA